MKILILASNPRKDLNLDDEIRILQGALNQSAKRDQFLVEKEVGVRVGDLQFLVLRHKPEIIHFCGHGSGEEGLIFKVDGGGEQRVEASGLAGLFRLCPFVKCVLLNACYSEVQANVIAERTDYVIGMSHTIQDNAAIAFSKGFYTALGHDYSIEMSFEFGKNAIQLEVSESSIKRSGATAVEERKAEVVGVVETTELKEHEKPRIFIRGREQTVSDLDQSRSNQSIPDTKRDEVLLKIDASLGNVAENPKQKLETNITAPNQPRSHETRAAIQVDIDQSLKADSKASHQGTSKEVWQRFEFSVINVDKKGEENNRTRKSAEFFAEDLGCGVSLEIVRIPSGIFLRGSTENSDEMPQHTVTVPTFLMGKYPITQVQWRAVAALPQVEIALNPEPSNFKGDNRPVEQISWNDAMEFCHRLSRKTGHPYCLPSESEWEYACRAGTVTPFYFGEALTPKLARCKANLGMVFVTLFSGETSPVGSYFPNAFGLHDMHGNVLEWCQDHWHESYTGAPIDGSAWITGGDSNRRIVRGGSWTNNTRYCRSSSRDRDILGNRSDSFGFRIACSPERTQ